MLPLVGLPQADRHVWAEGFLEGLELVNPLANPSIVAIYDFVGKETVIGAEGAFLRHRAAKNWALTVGGVGDADGAGDGELRDRAREFMRSGTPFIGTRYDFSITDNFNIGAAVGRNLKEGKTIAGIKTAYKIKFW